MTPSRSASSQHRRALEHRAVLEQRDRQPVAVDPGDRQQLLRLAVALDVEPPHRDAVAGQEVAQVVRVAREAVADDAHAGLERRVRRPGRQQVLDHRVELLLGRVPRLEQVVVEVDLVDRLDRGLGVGVRGQQDALGVRHELARLDQVLGPGQPRHPLVGDQQRDLLAARDQLAQRPERLVAARGADDPVALAEAPPQVARDGGEHGGLVVDGDDRGSAAPRLGGLHDHGRYRSALCEQAERGGQLDEVDEPARIAAGQVLDAAQPIVDGVRVHGEVLGGAGDVEVAFGVGLERVGERGELFEAGRREPLRGLVGRLGEVVEERDLLERRHRVGVP